MSVRRRDERNSFLLNSFVVYKKGSLGLPTFCLPLITITRSFLFLYHLPYTLTYTYIVRFCMPPPPQHYPSFTLVMSSESPLFAPFAANDNMRLPAHRTSRPTRFHPYSRARPSLHQERLTVRLSHLCGSLHAQLVPIRPHWTIVFPNLLRALFVASHQSR
jgi:hypothetical protein